MTHRRFIVLLGLTAVGAGLALSNAWGQAALRTPVAVGAYYPSDRAELYRVVTDLLDKAAAPAQTVALEACVVPHSGYGLSGATTAHAFKHLLPGQYDRVIILGPSHYVPIENCWIADTTGYATPLGVVPLDSVAIRKLLRSPLINARSLNYGPRKGNRPPLHELEYSIEVVLPFLQVQLREFKLVPMLVGHLRDAKGNFSESAVEVVAEAIRAVTDDRTLIVVSAEFTRYGEDFNHVPFTENILEAIDALDQRAFECILARDTTCFRNYLRSTKNPLIGWQALHVLMKFLPKTARGQVVDHELSARLTGDTSRSVSYGAINFYDPTRPAPAPRRIPPLKITTAPAAAPILPSALEGPPSDE